MTKETKLTLITGYAFITLFFAALLVGVFITRAVALAMIFSFLNFMFFSEFYYKTEE